MCKLTLLYFTVLRATQVASVAIGANYKQTVEAFAEAEKYETWRSNGMAVFAITRTKR